jgi:uncharacterized protein YndB with AHSA1/START domain
VRLDRLVPASPDAVFAAWTDVALLRQWMSPFGSAEVELSSRVGGALRVVMVDGDTRIEHVGEFLEIDPPRRLRFTWLSEYTGGRPSLVTVDLTAVGAATRLVLTHEDLPAEVVDSHAGGWGTMLSRLVDVIGAASVSEVAR